MEKKSVPYRKTIFVCANVRTDGRLACGNPGRGGAELCAALKTAVKDAGLKGKIRVAKSGCLDLCARGPNVFVYPGEKWLSGAKPEDAPEILRDLLDS